MDRERAAKAAVLSALGIALAFMAGGAPPAAHGASFTVNSTADTVDATPGDGACADATGACTLRAAVMETNALAGADTVSVPAGTYLLTLLQTGESFVASLDITDELTLNGSGARTTVVDGGKQGRVFDVLLRPIPDPYPDVVFEVTDLAIRNGVPTGPDFGGGGIRVVPKGYVQMKRVSMTGNGSADRPGGAIYNGGSLQIYESTINNNLALKGGAIFNAGLLGVTDSTLSDNTAASGSGCTFVSEPSFSFPLYAVLARVTIVGNASAAGCTSQLDGYVGSTSSASTIVAANGAGAACSAPLGSNGHNLDSDGSCVVFPAAGDLSNVDPKLGPLADNGGPTQTHALLAGSPAIDAGVPECGGPPHDQRGPGFPRRVDGNGDGIAACDIGAFELQEAPPKPTPAPTRAPQQFAGSLPQTGGERAAGGDRFSYGVIAAVLAIGAGGAGAGWWAHRRYDRNASPPN
jgi:CSLREA domain-containing protein